MRMGFSCEVWRISQLRVNSTLSMVQVHFKSESPCDNLKRLRPNSHRYIISTLLLEVTAEWTLAECFSDCGLFDWLVGVQLVGWLVGCPFPRATVEARFVSLESCLTVCDWCVLVRVSRVNYYSFGSAGAWLAVTYRVPYSMCEQRPWCIRIGGYGVGSNL